MSIHNVEVGKFNPENVQQIERKDLSPSYGNDFEEIAGFDEEDWNNTFEKYEGDYIEKEEIEDDEIDDDL
ncbi:MAG: hypothetical protein XD93_0528 [candidate division WS6 bacterium 34_10]|uniref:Uncharacterized protein n=1 Tax=candidate division WS6 bacterium 34_10 TaxID=1641389 RepID=A0A101HHW4_9BACT|nr:MAG: hypothetical protein XD93_0528 [candidate division WS6 bacterium 34_10]